MSKMNIAVFFGSRSCEHDVSIVSALQCIEATKAAGFNVTPVYISRDGLWYTGEPLENIEKDPETRPYVAWDLVENFMIDAFKAVGVPEEDAKAE